MWKPIPSFPNYEFCNETLQVKSLARKSEDGRNLRTRILKPNLKETGYYFFSLWNGGGIKVLKRSSISWLVNTGKSPPKGLQIDHKDANKTNDCSDNLQLLTNRENISKGYQDRGKKLPTGVTKRKNTKKYRAQIRINGKSKSIGNYNSPKEASIAYQNKLKELIKTNTQFK